VLSDKEVADKKQLEVAADKKYDASANGKERRRRYATSTNGKAVLRRYATSTNGKAVRKRYASSSSSTKHKRQGLPEATPSTDMAGNKEPGRGREQESAGASRDMREQQPTCRAAEDQRAAPGLPWGLAGWAGARLLNTSRAQCLCVKQPVPLGLEWGGGGVRAIPPAAPSWG
jgi:hypothetical protein